MRNRREEAECANPVSLSRNAWRTSESAPPSKFPSPLAWVVGAGIIRPETNAPHWVQGAGFGLTFVASTQKVIFPGGVLREFGLVARQHGILLLSVPNSGVKVAHASTDAFVCTWVGRRHDELHCAMVYKKPGPLRPSYAAPRKNKTRHRRQTTNGTTAKKRTRAARTTPHFPWSIRAKGPKWTVPIPREQCLEFGPAMSPSRTTRPRDHDASSDPTVSRVVSPSLVGEKWQETALTAPDGAGGSKLLLLDERI